MVLSKVTFQCFLRIMFAGICVLRHGLLNIFPGQCLMLILTHTRTQKHLDQPLATACMY